MASGGPLRASTDVIAFAGADGQPGTANAEGVRRVLEALAAKSIVQYREFADEYRIWQGSDYDVLGNVRVSLQRLNGHSIAGVLNSLYPLTPAVAARHSQETGTLRLFSRIFVDATTGAVTPPDPATGADGLVAYAVGPKGFVPHVNCAESSTPVVVISADSVDDIRAAALSLAALRDVSDNSPPGPHDYVAHRELRDRLAYAGQSLETAIEATFGITAHATLWPGERPYDMTRGLSRVLSRIADDVYFATPSIQNEIINRNDLSSQAARARQLLIEALLDHPDEERLGLEGFGPERAMYEALLATTGMHKKSKKGEWTLAAPDASENIGAVWQGFEEALPSARDTHLGVLELFSALQQPPIGLRMGPLPIYFVAWLQHHADDVALYENDAFQPTLASDLAKRLTRAPGRFSIRSIPSERAFQTVLAALADALGIHITTRARVRNRPILGLAGALLKHVRSLSEYTVHTKSLSAETIAVRSALLHSREPDTLLFTDLPQALGLKPISGRTTAHVAKRFAKALAQGVRELHNADTRLQGKALEQLIVAIGEASGSKARTNLASRAAPLLAHVSEPRLRSFLLSLSDRGLDDEEWLINLCMNVAHRHPSVWRDDDVTTYSTEVRRLGAVFQHTEALFYEEGTAGADRMRIALTSALGDENARVVFLPDRRREELSQLVDEILDQVRTRAGENTLDLFVALLTQRIFASKDQQESDNVRSA